MALWVDSTGPIAARALAGLLIVPVLVSDYPDVIGDVLREIDATRADLSDIVNRVRPWRKRGQH